MTDLDKKTLDNQPDSPENTDEIIEVATQEEPEEALDGDKKKKKEKKKKEAK